MKINYYTVDELKILLDDTININQRSAQTGRTHYAIKRIEYLYREHKKGNYLKTQGLRIYNIFKKYDAQNSIEEIARETEMPVKQNDFDRYKKLEDAFTSLQTALIEFAEDEATRRSKEKILELEAKLNEKTKKYEEELAKMQMILVEAQESSVVSVLRRHFGK